MNLVLVLPPARPGEKRKFTAPPLGLLYLGSHAKKFGHQVTIIDSDVEGYTLDKLVEKILEKKPDIVGFTSMTPFAAEVLNLSKKIKYTTSQVKIVVGGIHVTATHEEMMTISPNIDFLVVSEGEYTLVELLDSLANNKPLNQIKGLIYRDPTNNQIIKNEPREPVPDLDALPIPDFDLIENFDIRNYDLVHAGGKRVVYILGSRGCPYLCTFCAAHLVHGQKVRYRDPIKIVDEIEHNLNKYKINYVGFKDGTFTVNHDWVKKICAEIKKRKLNIGFCINARVDTINEEILQVLKDAGCKTMGFGIESGSQRILDSMCKGTKIDQIKSVMKLVNKYKFFTIASFMIGNPGDTKDDIKATLELAKEIKTTGVGFCPLTAFPGTKIYYDAIKDGTLKNGAQWYYKKNPEHPDEYLETGLYDGVLTFSNFTTEEELKKTYNKFYLRPSYAFSIFKRIIKDPYFFKYALGYAWGLLRKTFDNT